VNFNAPGQVVIAGHAGAVARAIDAAKGLGAKRAVALPVSVPSHSRLMLGAAERLAERLAGVELRMPDVPAVYTVDVRKHESPDGIRRALKEQLYRPVRWAETVRAMLAAGVTELIECGPGKVLTALNRRIERRPDLTMLAVEDPDGLDAALAACREKDHG
jgi:[acyl-carrier-protein] S-malonyltransferase